MTLKTVRTAGGTVRALTDVGGTQRLHGWWGSVTALDMISTGKQLRARQALKAGLVDDVVPQNHFTGSSWSSYKKNARAATLPVQNERSRGRWGARCYFARCVKRRRKNAG